MKLDTQTIVTAGRDLQYFCHGQSVLNGWWHNLVTGESQTSRGYPRILPNKNVGELLCLVHTEISGAMEGYRKGEMDVVLTSRTRLEVELADAVIRIMDISGGLGLDVPGAIAAKLAYNAIREDHKPENRQAVGGKKF
jgi:hypothetical protein